MCRGNTYIYLYIYIYISVYLHTYIYIYIHISRYKYSREETERVLNCTMNGPSIELHSQFAETHEPYESLVNQRDGKFITGKPTLSTSLPPLMSNMFDRITRNSALLNRNCSLNWTSSKASIRISGAVLQTAAEPSATI
jgi:hypothetical protein